MSNGVFDPTITLDAVTLAGATKAVAGTTKAVAGATKAVAGATVEATKAIAGATNALAGATVEATNTTLFDVPFDLPFDLSFDLPIDDIVEYKEYWIVGIVVLLLIGYYSYSIVMKNSVTLKELLNNNILLNTLNKNTNKDSNKDSNKLK